MRYKRNSLFTKIVTVILVGFFKITYLIFKMSPFIELLKKSAVI